MSQVHSRDAQGTVLFSIVTSISLSLLLGWAALTYVVRPFETVSVDYKALSEAKLAALTQKVMQGQPVSTEELQGFLVQLNTAVDEAAKGRLVFMAGTLLNAEEDITDAVAVSLGLDMSKSLIPNLSNMANSVDGTLRDTLQAKPAVPPVSVVPASPTVVPSISPIPVPPASPSARPAQ